MGVIKKKWYPSRFPPQRLHRRENRWNTDVCRPLWTKLWSHAASHYDTAGGWSGSDHFLQLMEQIHPRRCPMCVDNWDLMALITRGVVFFLQTVQDFLGFSVVFWEEFLLLTLDDQNLCVVFAEGGKVLLGDNKCQSSKLRRVLLGAAA